MSYIRSTSNPDHIYIWREVAEVFISEGSGNLKPPWRVPTKEFHALARTYVRGGRGVTPLRRGKLRLTETKDFKIKLAYGRRAVVMWEVTWDYIARNVAWEFDECDILRHRPRRKKGRRAS